MYDRGALRPEADPEKLATTLLATLQGGLLLTQTKRDPAPLATALDSALTYVESFAAIPPSDPSAPALTTESAERGV